MESKHPRAQALTPCSPSAGEVSPSQMEAAMARRCPKAGEVEQLYLLREQLVRRLIVQGTVREADVRALDRLGRCQVASDQWALCDEHAKALLLADGHHQVRACAAISAMRA